MLTNRADQDEVAETTLINSGPNSGGKLVKAILILLLIAAIPLGFVFFAEKREDGAKSKKKLPVIVTSAFVKQQDVPLAIHAVGNVESMESVSVRSRVDGELMEVFFKEGEDVKKGDLLFKIDPKTLHEMVEQANANLAQSHSEVLQQEALIKKASAELRRLRAALESTVSKEKLAKRQWDRYSDLVKQGAVSQEQEDQMRTNYETMEASVRADHAAIENQQAVIDSDRSRLLSLKSKEHSAKSALDQAKIQLGYCSIYSPTDGRTGTLLVHRGNMVKGNDMTPLVVINKLRPIYVSFALPESEFVQVKSYEQKGPLSVDVVVSGPDGGSQPSPGLPSSASGMDSGRQQHNLGSMNQGVRVRGMLTFMDNAVQTSTGTIKLKATFPNDNGVLWPGQFVNVSLNLTTFRNAIVVPLQAVQVGQQGQYVFVIKPDNSVEVRPVKVLRNYERLAVLSHGLAPGEQVVTDGQVQLTSSSTVSVSNPTPQ